MPNDSFTHRPQYTHMHSQTRQVSFWWPALGFGVMTDIIVWSLWDEWKLG